MVGICIPSRCRSRDDLTWRRVLNSLDSSKLYRVSEGRNPLGEGNEKFPYFRKCLSQNNLVNRQKAQIHLFPSSGEEEFFKIMKT